jgi:endonuclease/exonuclease/phosphatase (EEP) superfamily protein YafD
MKSVDRWLKRLGQVLADDTARRGCLAKVARLIGRGFAVLAFAHAALLLFLIAAFRWVGENHLTLAFLLYLPRVIFLLPAPFLLLPAVLCRRWTATLALSGASLLFLNVAMDLRWRGAAPPTAATPGASLIVLTYNRGEHANQSLQPFKNHVRPDLIVLQEAPGRAAGYLAAEGYGEFPHARDVAEFTLLSRYPILSAEGVPTPPGTGFAPVAARFTIDFSGTPVAVYSVHTASPRDTLLYYRRGAFLHGLIGLPGTPFAEKRRANQSFWDRRIAEARQLAEQVAADPLPTIVAGDFNAPAGGYIHGLFAARFEDAHRAAGHGFGHSFPGTTRNPLSRGGPWMRIDYLFCDEVWESVWCLTEARRPSQHRAVAAMFRLR